MSIERPRPGAPHQPRLSPSGAAFEEAALRSGRGCIASESLFGNARELVIKHNGEAYLLRITRNQKLILTK